MNEWMNEWTKYLMDLLHNLIFSKKYHFVKSKKIITTSITRVRFMPTIIRGQPASPKVR